MITEIYEPLDDESKRSLEMVQALFESDVLMAGLGKDCANYAIPKGFPVVANVEKSYALLSLEPDWDADVLEHQYFEDVIIVAVQRYERYEFEETVRRAQPIRNNIDEMGAYLSEELLKVIEKHGILEHLSAVHENEIDQQRLKEIVELVYPNCVAGNFMKLAEASLFGGIETWPIAHRLYQCYETGGIPVGWVGALPGEGGLPQECMQLLHYGPQTNN